MTTYSKGWSGASPLILNSASYMYADGSILTGTKGSASLRRAELVVMDNDELRALLQPGQTDLNILLNFTALVRSELGLHMPTTKALSNVTLSVTGESAAITRGFFESRLGTPSAPSTGVLSSLPSQGGTVSFSVPYNVSTRYSAAGEMRQLFTMDLLTEVTNGPFPFGSAEGLVAATLELNTSGPVTLADGSGRRLEDLGVRYTITPQAAVNTIQLVPAGAGWQFLDDGSDQGTAWYASNFNDSTWKSGVGRFGYGGTTPSDIPNTVIDYGSDPQHKHVTTFFRHEFDVANPTQLMGLMLEIQRDDGAAVYLNGTEVARDLLSNGAAYNTFALSPEIFNSDQQQFFPYNIDPRLLVQGRNVLAVEVHQATPSLRPADMVFDLRLTGVPLQPPPLSFRRCASRRSGLTQDDPILPSRIVWPHGGAGNGGGGGAVMWFISSPTRRWYDPPVAEGYTYDMLGNSLFTDIMDFPVGFASAFSVSVGSIDLPGTFGNGEHVLFSDFGAILGDLLVNGTGVHSFTVTGIHPEVNTNSDMAFPLMLAFSTEMAEFTMTPQGVSYRLDGDFNGDNVVDRSDAALLASNFGRVAARYDQGDFDGDTVVGLADLAFLQSRLGQSLPPPSPAAQVPEPSTLHLATLAALSAVLHWMGSVYGSFRRLRRTHLDR